MQGVNSGSGSDGGDRGWEQEPRRRKRLVAQGNGSGNQGFSREGGYEVIN